MSQLNYLEKLLDGVVVEWIALREVVKTVTAPAKLKRESYRETGKTPIIDQGEKFITGYTDEDVKALPLGEYVIFGDHSEHIKYVDFSFIQGADGLKILKSISDNPKYVYYSFLNFYKKELNYKRHWASASETLIPIPCPDNPEKSLAIQAEIVRILDAFTAMTTELTTELNLRKKQYNYYRDKLLSFEEGDVEWRALSEMAEYSKARISYTELDDSNYVGVESLLQNRAGKIDSTRTPDSGNLTQYNPDDILIGNIRPYLKKIWHADRVGGTNGDVLVVHPTDTAINPRYLYQVLADDKFFEYNMQHAKGAKMPRGNKPKIMEYLVPIPFASDREKSLSEQKRIVTILDKFDTLTNSITEGLPREIELRQKQYEYYRDLLLSFPKSNEGAA
ncbi:MULTISPECIES: restriction endonuclease subunit S [Vibrio harveyi group]|nr:restriction endonuclease subunit S [Vibrio alginolyticus]MBS9852725.1 restriction endonuclease subunit S [Vibrio alginolyticus]MDW1971122.1 restriction endonuclease subunit S [Vibrio sp. 945]